MKLRLGFVTNSSSSSFIINNYSELDEDKIDQLLNMRNYLGDYYEFESVYGLSVTNKCAMEGLSKDEYVSEYEYDMWEYDLDLEGDRIIYYTGMDNFDISEYVINFVGIDECDTEINY